MTIEHLSTLDRVSIPSQAGTLFGLRGTEMAGVEMVCLNTLSGGHPLRTYAHLRAARVSWVSIPSQAGTLFGLTYGRCTVCNQVSLNTLSGGHPLRTRGARPFRPC